MWVSFPKQFGHQSVHYCIHHCVCAVCGILPALTMANFSLPHSSECGYTFGQTEPLIPTIQVFLLGSRQSP